VCSNGACASSCTQNQTLCTPDGGSAYCANTQNDNANCGSCGNVCGNGLVCSNGVCSNACASVDGGVETLCVPDGGSPYCANTQTDDANCGACGNACGNGFKCVGGACSNTCQFPYVSCVVDGGPMCVNTQSDANNCGSCNNACPNGQGCLAGVCSTRIVAGFNGQLGPDYSGSGYKQCIGYLSQANKIDIPTTGWANACEGSGMKTLRVACGANANSVRYIDVGRNVFMTGLNGYPENGLITASNFALTGGNVLYADTNNQPNDGRSWWATGGGCSEADPGLTINNLVGPCAWRVNNCFGQNLAGDRYLYVYAHP
jgi:hypothetical protein